MATKSKKYEAGQVVTHKRKRYIVQSHYSSGAVHIHRLDSNDKLESLIVNVDELSTARGSNDDDTSTDQQDTGDAGSTDGSDDQ